MNRELTRREKILLLVLIVVVLVAGYCKLILIPINDQISSYRLNMEAEQTELDANQGKMAQMQKMQRPSKRSRRRARSAPSPSTTTAAS